MSRTVIDLDDELLVEVARALGTSTKKDTVNRSFSVLSEFRARLVEADARRRCWTAFLPRPGTRGGSSRGAGPHGLHACAVGRVGLTWLELVAEALPSALNALAPVSPRLADACR